MLLATNHNYINKIQSEYNEIMTIINQIESIIDDLNSYSTYQDLFNCKHVDIFENEAHLQEYIEDNDLEDMEESEVVAMIVEIEIENLKSNAHYDRYKDKYISLNELYNQSDELCDNLQQQTNLLIQINDILKEIPFNHVSTSYKSISTYVTCNLSDYLFIIDKLDSYDLEVINESDDLDGLTFEIRISDHESGSHFDPYSFSDINYNKGDVSIIL